MRARVAAVMTSHNRRDQTLACLDALHRRVPRDVELELYVLDDGSSDGTAEAVRQRYPGATILHGDGSLYWNRGMHEALKRAFERDHDYYLWLNDDTILDESALGTLLDTARALQGGGRPPRIVVGSTRDPDSGTLTYGGRGRLSRVRRTAFRQVRPGPEPVPTETMNGNVVLVPREVVERVGNIDPAYHHKWGDEDYGLRARARGCELWLAPGTVGTCARNPDPAYGERPLRAELRDLWSIKGLQPSDWARFTRRWAGPLWPLYWLSPYVRRILRMLSARVPGGARGSGRRTTGLRAPRDLAPRPRP